MLDQTHPVVPATVPLHKLRFGDDRPGGSVNARGNDRREGLDELAASLLAHGVIHPLVVDPWGKDDFYVINGNRRLAALRALASQNKIAKDHPVKTVGLDPGTDPLEASLAANIMVVPMHEVDQYEAFAGLAEGGRGAAEIASHFGTTELMVRRRLALGKLAPTIRAAWREGKVAVDTAQAFTIVEDQALQEQTFQALAKGQNLYRSSVIRALTGDQESWMTRRHLALVGKSEFVAAGGRIAEDLFEPDAPKILDVDVLTRLTRERVEIECARLVADGWTWAAWDRDLPVGHGSWKRAALDGVPFGEDGSADRNAFEELRTDMQKAGGMAGPMASHAQWKAHDALNSFLDRPEALVIMPLAAKAVSGCKVTVDGEGQLKASGRWLRPGEVQPTQETVEATAEAPDVGTAAAAAGISAALSQSLSEQRTIAAAGALSSDPALALRLIVATLQSRRSPARISARGFAGLVGLQGIGTQTWAHKGAVGPSFVEAFHLTEGSSTGVLLAELAALVAASLDLTDAARENAGIAVLGQGDLVDALDPGIFLTEARRAFDPEGYFDRVSSKMIVAAIVEMHGTNTCESTRKPDLVQHAAAAARDAGWLPVQLRCEAYDLIARDAA